MNEVFMQTPNPLTLSAYFIFGDDDGYRGGKSKAIAIVCLERVGAIPISVSNASGYVSS